MERVLCPLWPQLGVRVSQRLPEQSSPRWGGSSSTEERPSATQLLPCPLDNHQRSGHWHNYTPLLCFTTEVLSYHHANSHPRVSERIRPKEEYGLVTRHATIDEQVPGQKQITGHVFCSVPCSSCDSICTVFQSTRDAPCRDGHTQVWSLGDKFHLSLWMPKRMRSS